MKERQDYFPWLGFHFGNERRSSGLSGLRQPLSQVSSVTCQVGEIPRCYDRTDVSQSLPSACFQII